MGAFTVALADGACLAGSIEGGGEGPDILLVSGLGGTAAFWNPVMPLLTRQHRTIRFDQRGVGRSTRGTAPVTIDQLAEDCLAVLDAAGSGGALLVGHSTGGCIVQAAARQAPRRVLGLVLSATWLKPSRFMDVLFGARLALLRASPRDYAALTVLLGYPPDDVRENWQRVEEAIANAPEDGAARAVVEERIAALLSFDASGWTAELAMPRLVVGAEDDMVVPAFLQRELAAAHPGGALKLFPTGGHFYVAARRHELVAAIRGWWTS